MIVLRGVSVRYGHVRALDGVDLEVARGARLAILGPSGSGKSTLLRVIAGLDPAESGDVHLDGRPMSPAVPPWERGVGMAFQRPGLWPHLTVRGNVAFGLEGRPGADARVDALLARLGLAALATRRPHALSGGEAQRVGLARALAPARPILLLDEPFTGLDEALVAQVIAVVRDEADAIGATVLLVGHDPRASAALCDQVVTLRAGRVERAPGPWPEAGP